MNIVYTLNDKFVPQVAASICSICENNKEEKITFYIISLNIEKYNKQNLSKLVEKYKNDIKIIELENLEKFFNVDIDTKGWNKIVLARLILDSLIPQSIGRILYLDGDTIVRGSIKELYNIDFEGKIIGMSIEPTIEKERIKILNLGDNLYCNAGILMIDMNAWRKNNLSSKFVKYYENNYTKLFANDQDVINAVCKDKIKYISPRYNYSNIYDQYSYSFMKKNLLPKKYDKYISKEDYYESRKNPIIIHYLGEERPWRIGNTHRFRKDFAYYLSKTFAKNMKMESGWRSYFICWKIFNTITKPFPALRLKIINSLIPKFMKARAKKIKKENK